MDAADLGVWLTSIAQRVHVRITAGQQNTIKPVDDAPNEVGSWDKRNVNRQTACGFDGFAIVPSQIKSLRLQFNTHRDADARSVLLSHSKKTDARINFPERFS